MEQNMCYQALEATTSNAADPKYAMVAPTYNDDGSIFMHPEDGNVLGPFEVDTISHRVSTCEATEDVVEMLEGLSKYKIVDRDGDLQMLITEARLIVYRYDPRPDYVTYCVVTNIWYEWFEMLDSYGKKWFWETESFLIYMTENFPIEALGFWNHLVALIFDKPISAMNLADILAKRVAAHNLKYAKIEGEDRVKLEEILTKDAPNPQDGREASYLFYGSTKLPEAPAYLVKE